MARTVARTVASYVRAVIYRLPSPTSLTFFACLFAGVGINMLTSFAIDPAEAPDKGIAVSDAILWVVAAGFLVAVAQQLEGAEREAALYTDGRLRPEEKSEVRREKIDLVARSASVLLGLAILSLIAAVTLLLVLLE